MSDRDGKSAGRSGVIIRPAKGVFSEVATPNGGSVKVMSREVYTKASRAAGAEIKKASRQSAGHAQGSEGGPVKGRR